MITQLRTLQQFGRIILDISVGYKELIEAADTTENTTLRTGSHTDIMERLNGDSIAYQTVHSYWTYHVNKNRSTPVHGGKGTIDPDGWNVYGVDIDPDSLVFRINGTPTFTYHRIDSLADKGQYPFFCTQYLLIDMQLGGAWVGRVEPADLPVEMEIDWVRNWVRTDLVNEEKVGKRKK